MQLQACHVVTQLHTINVLVHAADSHPLSIAHICVGLICRSVGEPDYRGSVSGGLPGSVCEPDCRDLWVNRITWDLCVNRITWDLCVNRITWDLCVNRITWDLCVNRITWDLCVNRIAGICG